MEGKLSPLRGWVSVFYGDFEGKHLISWDDSLGSDSGRKHQGEDRWKWWEDKTAESWGRRIHAKTGSKLYIKVTCHCVCL